MKTHRRGFHRQRMYEKPSTHQCMILTYLSKIRGVYSTHISESSYILCVHKTHYGLKALFLEDNSFVTRMVSVTVYWVTIITWSFTFTYCHLHVSNLKFCHLNKIINSKILINDQYKIS